jgi:hypothetical protein
MMVTFEKRIGRNIHHEAPTAPDDKAVSRNAAKDRCARFARHPKKGILAAAHT